MTIKNIIQVLKNLRNHPNRTPEEVQAIDKTISQLENNKNRDQLISATKILADLINIGIKIFDS